MKILEVLNEFYDDFEFIKEKWNEKYENVKFSILINDMISPSF